MADRDLSDYNEVEHRIQEFRDKYPNGSLQGDWRVHSFSGGDYIAYRAEAYRSESDPRPGVGAAWELVPGRTPFTRGSELQNAETSAWGRAIIAVGAADAKKGIASRQEVESRMAERERVKVTAEDERLRYGVERMTPEDRPGERLHKPVENDPVDKWIDQPTGEFDIGTPEDRPGSIDSRTLKRLQMEFRQYGIEDRDVRLGLVTDWIGREVMSANQLSQAEGLHIIKKLKQKAGGEGD